MKAIRTQDEASYRGRYVAFDPIWSWPQPARPGGPPILVGGKARGMPDRVERLAEQLRAAAG